MLKHPGLFALDLDVTSGTTTACNGIAVALPDREECQSSAKWALSQHEQVFSRSLEGGWKVMSRIYNSSHRRQRRREYLGHKRWAGRMEVAADIEM